MYTALSLNSLCRTRINRHCESSTKYPLNHSEHLNVRYYLQNSMVLTKKGLYNNIMYKTVKVFSNCSMTKREKHFLGTITNTL